MSISIKPVEPALTAVVFGVTDFETVSGGVGGWETLERPRQQAATEWVGTPEKTLTLPLILDGIEKGGIGIDRPITAQIAAVDSWGVKHDKTRRPPILSVTGSRYTTPSERWVVQNIEWGEFSRDDHGRIVQQELTLTLLRYLAPTLAVGPAAKTRDNKPKDGEKTKKKRRKRKKRK